MHGIHSHGYGPSRRMCGIIQALSPLEWKTLSQLDPAKDMSVNKLCLSLVELKIAEKQKTSENGRWAWCFRLVTPTPTTGRAGFILAYVKLVNEFFPEVHPEEPHSNGLSNGLSHVFLRALRIYQHRFGEFSENGNPDASLSGWDGSQFILRNEQKVLARFKYRASIDRLSFISDK